MCCILRYEFKLIKLLILFCIQADLIARRVKLRKFMQETGLTDAVIKVLVQLFEENGRPVTRNFLLASKQITLVIVSTSHITQLHISYSDYSRITYKL